jgi:hypothetical protein
MLITRKQNREKIMKQLFLGKLKLQSHITMEENIKMFIKCIHLIYMMVEIMMKDKKEVQLFLGLNGNRNTLYCGSVRKFGFMHLIHLDSYSMTTCNVTKL